MKIIKLGMMLVLGMFVAACGGGGSSGDPQPSSEADVPYTGKTSPASITTANAKELTLDVFQQGTIGGAPVASLNGEVIRAASQPRGLLLKETLEKAIRHMDPRGASSGLAAAIQDMSDTFPGSCGGGMSFRISYDDQSGEFSGETSFANYCEEGIVTNGDMSFDGLMDVESGEFLSFTMTMDSLSVKACGDTFTTDGTLKVVSEGDASAYVSTMTLDIYVTEGGTGQVYWVKGMTMKIEEGYFFTNISVQGRFYHPDYGYVDVRTEHNLQVYDDNFWPSSGVMVAEGADGSVARLTAINSESYRLQVDEDGDGVYESDEILAWDDWDICKGE